MGMNIVGVHRDSDKLVSATEAILQMKNRRIWLPQYADWLQDAEDEVFTWQGHPDEPDDVIDNLSDACNHIDWSNVGPNPGNDYMMVNDESLPAAHFYPDHFGH
jgi:predicted CoA-binding protein